MLIKHKRNESTVECFAKLEVTPKNSGMSRYKTLFLVKGNGGNHLSALKEYFYIDAIDVYREGVDIGSAFLGRNYYWETGEDFILFGENNESCLSLLTKE